MSARVTVTLEELVLLKAEARGFSLLPRQPLSSLLSGRYASRLRGRGLTFEEMRQYRQGDDVRTIDWKATARLRTPYVRVYNEERERPVFIVLDQRTPMFFGSQRVMKSVAAAECASLAAWRALQSGDRVGGLVFNEAEVVELRPHRSQTSVLRFLHETVRLNQTLETQSKIEGETTLNNAMEIATRKAVHDYLVVLISDLDGVDERTERLATTLAAHNDVLVVAVYDPLGASLVAQDGMLAFDRGNVWELPTGSDFAKQFQLAFQGKLDRWVETFRALRVAVLPISTASPAAEQIRALFGQHAGQT